MTFEEWAAKYGKASARKWFNLGDHMVFVVHPGRRVTGLCGKWFGSQPLGINPDVEYAKQCLRDAVCNCFDTEETIYETEEKREAASLDAEV